MGVRRVKYLRVDCVFLLQCILCILYDILLWKERQGVAVWNCTWFVLDVSEKRKGVVDSSLCTLLNLLLRW